MTTNEKLTYLFSKINWAGSNMDAKAIEFMNSIPSEIDDLVNEVNTLRSENEALQNPSNDDYFTQLIS